MRGATLKFENKAILEQISIHTPHAGSDLVGALVAFNVLTISIHTPHAGSDWSNREIHHGHRDFNPHSPCGERPFRFRNRFSRSIFQSTLPMRGATRCFGITFVCRKISIHTPHAGSDTIFPWWYQPHQHFNPHSPCGERPLPVVIAATLHLISIHTPHAGSDFDGVEKDWKNNGFQSTLPMRGATNEPEKCGCVKGISIHTPHAGSDS